MSKEDDATLISHERWREALGLVVMALAVLIALALVTYHPADNGLARTLSADTFGSAPPRAHNLLGVVGAGLAYTLVPLFLGYTSILLAALAFTWGYAVLSHRSLARFPLYALLTACGAFLLATLFGWIGHAASTNLTLWSGGVGLGAAVWLWRILGPAGSLILIVVGLALVMLFAFDRSVRHPVQRAESALRRGPHRLIRWVRDRLDAFRQRRQKRREARQKQREEPQNRADTDSPSNNGTDDVPGRPNAQQQEKLEDTAPDTDRGDVAAQRLHDGGDDSDTETPDDRTGDAPPSRENVSPSPRKGDAPRRPNDKDDDSAPGEPELHVQTQIEEEKADDLTHDDADEPDQAPFAFPTIDLLDESAERDKDVARDELEHNKRLLLDKLDTHNIEITEINAVVGPTVTRYELTPAEGVKISRITSLEDDLGMALAASGIRTLAPIPGKSAVGVEIPNRNRELVRIRDVIGTAKFRDADMDLPVAVGKSIEGEIFIRDLAKMPHLLVAGATGSGKSVGLNALITCLLYACHPATLKFVVIDPKKIELQQYAGLLQHYMAMPEDVDDPITTEVEQSVGVLQSLEREMEQRYDLLSKATVRNLKAYNKKFRAGKLSEENGHQLLPYLVVVVDELADLMMSSGNEVEGPIARLAQKARAVGIHLVVATQRPSVDVITGLIKANFPARMAYEVATSADSRTIMDQGGAEGLVGNGDLLFQAGSRTTRLQGPLVTLPEIEGLIDFIGEQPAQGTYELPPIQPAPDDLDDMLASNDRDEYFEQAARVTVRRQRGSVSLLQRKLSVGYTRAARIVDQLEDAGVVGPHVGSKARDVLVSDEEALEAMLHGDDE
jgi:S-DNA-T family DNA segregation ATPase FtsK/SpoIIIE